MSWIKISNKKEGIFAEEAEQDPKRIVSRKRLRLDINALQREINRLERQKLKYPNNASDDMKRAVDDWNKNNIEPIIVLRETELNDKLKILDEINGE